MYSIAKDIGDILKQSGKTIATAESITGGLIASAFVSVPNSSGWFLQGCVTYSNEAKADRLNVHRETLEKYGAVSKQVAKEMAEGIRVTSKADIGISTTGYAGPTGGDKQNPIGTVYIGISTRSRTAVYRVRLLGSRNRVRRQAAFLALALAKGLIISELQS